MDQSCYFSIPLFLTVLLLYRSPYNTPDRIAEYTYSKDPGQDDCCKGDLYLDFIEREIIPFAQKHLRIIGSGAPVSANASEEAALSSVGANSAPVGILGSSLGGLISCYAGWTRPSVYATVGCMSSSFWYDFMVPDLAFSVNLCLWPH